MEEQHNPILGTNSARVISSTTKSQPFWPGASPRWLLRFFEAYAHVPVSGGRYRVNRMTEPGVSIRLASDLVPRYLPYINTSVYDTHEEGHPMTPGSVQYDTAKQVELQPIQSVVRINTRIPALHSDTHDQLQYQISLTADVMNETKEHLMIHHPDYGLANNLGDGMSIDDAGDLTLDVLDDMLELGWKRPDVFVMHPEALGVVRRQATAQGIALEEASMFGSSFTLWRGLPIVPTNKLPLITGDSTQTMSTEATTANREHGQSKTDVYLIRLGEEKSGVVSLHAAGSEGSPRLPFITVEFMGTTTESESSYLLSTYTGMAVLSPGALTRATVAV